jgi:ABC-type bacteriocin/lantibiotic exporter with double-glycine peptidase domain
MTNSPIKRLWAHIAPRRKKQLGFLVVISVITSFAEVVSIGAVLPFLGVLMSPEKVFANADIQPIVSSLEVTDPNQLLLPLTLLFIAAAAFSAGMRITLIWAQTRLGHAIGADLSLQIYEKTLYQPYPLHVSRNSSEVIAGISGKINSVVYSSLLPLLNAISSVLILLTIMAVLIAIDPVVAVATFGGFGVVYALIMVLFRKRLIQNSQRISRESNQVVKALQEGLGGIRDVLIDGTQAVYCKIYRSADLPLRRAQAHNQIIGASPRFLIEALGIALIAALAYALTGREGGVTAAIPLLGALAIGAQRLLPLLQQLYGSWSNLRGGQASLNDVLDLIGQPLPAYAGKPASQQLPFNQSIMLANISFRYTDDTPWVLRDIHLDIPKGARVGFIGTTGSGKSTLLDIFMALLLPSKGNLVIDDIVITEQNFRNWQAHIAHVPQSLFLADTTIAENIAFGVPPGQIDYQRVEIAAQKAQIAKTIESWGKGYNTLVGERGERLSGGQRQRIGIARAFYKQADVIIFDEATSALDNETESAVMNAIDAISDDITVLMVAHRLSTLKSCDVVYELEAGKIERSGTYREIMQDTKIVAFH